jgi:hypothetical protein
MLIAVGLTVIVPPSKPYCLLQDYLLSCDHLAHLRVSVPTVANLFSHLAEITLWGLEHYVGVSWTVRAKSHTQYIVARVFRQTLRGKEIAQDVGISSRVIALY